MTQPTQVVDRGNMGAGQGSLKSYLTGFVLSVVLTLIAFLTVMYGGGGRETMLLVIVVCAVAQIAVHLVCFLHLNRSSDGEWYLAALIFAALVMIILVGGSLWVMYHLNANMMPH